MVEDPFAGTNFTDLLYYSAESLGYDLNKFSKTLSLDGVSPLSGNDGFADAVGVSPFALGQPLNSYLTRVEGLNASLANPEEVPPLDVFTETRAAYRRIIDEVFAEFDLDALVYPQVRPSSPRLAPFGSARFQIANVLDCSTLAVGCCMG